MEDPNWIEYIVDLLVPIVPIVVLLLGGQKLLDTYSVNRKKGESEIELISSIRSHQYETLQELYNLFARFMRLYRKMNSPIEEIESKEQRLTMYNEIIEAESAIDALVLKIGCEFAKENDDQEELEYLLGNLRQSVQIWRKSFVNEKKLPFTFSDQHNYMRFKSAFAYTAAFISNRLHENIEPHKTKMKRVENILVGAFHNKHEAWMENRLKLWSKDK